MVQVLYSGALGANGDDWFSDTGSGAEGNGWCGGDAGA